MQKGFTLIELLVVVLIIAILAAVALPQYQLAVAKSRVVTLLPLMKSIQQAQRLYYLEHGSYTDNFNKLTIEFPAGAKTVQNLKLVYEDFSCYAGAVSSGNTSLKCENGTGVILEQYYEWNWMTCWFYSNERGKKICKSLCGSIDENAKLCSF